MRKDALKKYIKKHSDLCIQACYDDDVFMSESYLHECRRVRNILERIEGRKNDNQHYSRSK